MEGIFKKLAAIFRIFIFMILCIIGKIIYTQFINPPEITDEDIAYRVEDVLADRGNILARDGRPLATSIPYYKLALDCAVCHKDTVKKYIDELAKELSGFFKDKSKAEYKRILEKGYKQGKRYLVLNRKLVDYSDLAIIRTFPILKYRKNVGGFCPEKINVRTSPYDKLGRMVIGYTRNGMGRGIEGSYDYYLKGTPGKRVTQKIPGGKYREVSGDETLPSVDGYDIQTTIDIDIQEIAEQSLINQIGKSEIVSGATVIVMEVATGAIRAMVNLKANNKGGYDESYNYAVADATEPGSTFKLISLVSLLEDGYVTLDTPIDAGNGIWKYAGATFTDTRHGGYGLLTVKKAFEKSSNVSFAKLAVKYYEKNPRKFLDRIQSLRMGEKLNLDIQGEGVSDLIFPDEQRWSPSTLPSTSIGYSTRFLPLHTATFYNAIANDGKMMKPYFVENYQKNGKIISRFKPQEISGAICSEKTARMAKEALRGVVAEGTGKMLDNDYCHISGKTGTARISYGKEGYTKNGKRRYQASFAGFFPSENPKYTMVILVYSKDLQSNFYGATWACPVFKNIADFIYKNDVNMRKEICSDKNNTLINELRAEGARAEKIIKQTNKKDIDTAMISVINMGVKDAVCLLENKGYKVKFTGFGKVVEQNPEPGSKIDKDTVITLKLSENEVK